MQNDTTFTANFINHSGYLTQVAAKCKIRQSTQMKSAIFLLADLPILCNYNRIIIARYRLMELTKYGGTEILAHIKHDLRQLPQGKSYGNESIDTELSHKNYSLIDRGKTAKEVNQYRKDFENKIFKYNRKNLVHAVELVIQCPSDCPPEQHETFFQTAFDWYCDNYLPAGKDCVFVAEIHKDEHKWVETENGLKDISKEHLHIAYVPAVPAREKHPDFEYRLNADALTKRAILRDMHPSMQATLDKAGIKATVYQKKSGDGKAVPLTVKQLKEITNKTGVVIDHTLTVDELANILSKNVELSQKVDVLTTANAEQKHNIFNLNNKVNKKEHQISNLQSELKSKTDTVTADKEKAELQAKLQEKYLENQKLRQAAQQIIFEKERQLSNAQNVIAAKEQEISQTARENQKMQEQIKTLQESLKTKDLELQQERQKVTELEAKKPTVSATPKEHTWGADSGWGSTSGWGNTANKEHTVEEEKLW